MQVNVLIADRNSESFQRRLIKFDHYETLRELVDQFEKQTGFHKCVRTIFDFSGDCDWNELEKIERGN